MARPTKQGIDFFSLDCVFDDDLQLFVAENSADSLGILIVIWQIIYQNEGYFVVHDKKLTPKIKQRILSDSERINFIIKEAVSWGIFSERLFNKHKILTSSGIQKRYFAAAKRKKTIKVCSDFLLVDINADIYSVNADIYSVCVGINATKEKEKEKEKAVSFETFYFKYPIKKSKEPAKRKWKTLSSIEKQAALAGIDGYMETVSDQNYLVHPSTYLNQKRWQDESQPKKNMVLDYV